ncbi:unnamed protein product, partial [Rotaria sp. Silwood1]
METWIFVCCTLYESAKQKHFVSILGVTKISNKDDESIEMLYLKSCLDLNMDMETKLDAWRSYEHIRKHYVLEGDQLH